jgi:hypothetical protein
VATVVSLPDARPSAALARLDARVALHRSIVRFPDMELLDDAPR